MWEIPANGEVAITHLQRRGERFGLGMGYVWREYREMRLNGSKCVEKVYHKFDQRLKKYEQIAIRQCSCVSVVDGKGRN